MFSHSHSLFVVVAFVFFFATLSSSVLAAPVPMNVARIRSASFPALEPGSFVGNLMVRSESVVLPASEPGSLVANLMVRSEESEETLLQPSSDPSTSEPESESESDAGVEIRSPQPEAAPEPAPEPLAEAEPIRILQRDANPTPGCSPWCG